jgi:hypothetical protein
MTQASMPAVAGAPVASASTRSKKKSKKAAAAARAGYPGEIPGVA